MHVQRKTTIDDIIAPHSFRKGSSNLRLSPTPWHGDELKMNQKALTVLVIDDDHDVAELLACFLARAKWRPVIALNGTAGVQQALALLPSLILCDSCMLEVDGLEVIRRLRGDPTTEHIPIVLMSGHEAARFDGAGADAFLQKPFQMDEMLALARSLLPEQSSVTAQNIGGETLAYAS
jgi:DNA-binding response OmpR family regulator